MEDLDGDQLPEIILGGSGLLYRNRGKSFEKQPLSGPHLRFRAGALGEFTGDGQADWFAIAPDGGFPGKGKWSWLCSNGRRGKSGHEVYFSSMCGNGDVDGDGDLDVCGAIQTPYGGGQMPTPYYDANGTGRFVDATEMRAGHQTASPNV